MDKSELLNTLRAARAQLEARLAEMSEAQLTERAAPEAWSVKDNLTHLTYWEQYMLDKVRQAVYRGEAPQQVTNEEETQINAQVFEDSKNRPLNEVMADMRRSLGQVVEQVRALSEADVTDPTRFAWLNGEPLMKYVADETYGEHYQEHLGHLMAWERRGALPERLFAVLQTTLVFSQFPPRHQKSLTVPISAPCPFRPSGVDMPRSLCIIHRVIRATSSIR